MVWQKNGTPDTLTIAGDVATISDLTAAKTNLFLWHKITSGEGSNDMTFNNNTNSVYAFRQSVNGAADGTFVSQADITMGISDTNEDFIIQYFSSVSGEEKLGIGFQCNRRTVGATDAPFRAEYISKFVPSPDADITRIDMDNLTGAGDYGIDTNLSALSDVVAAPATVGGWVELGRTTLGSTSTSINVASLPNKRYYKFLYNAVPDSGTTDPQLRLNSDTALNYSRRFSINGAADGSQVNRDAALLQAGGARATQDFSVGYLANLSSKEKLIQNYYVEQNTAGAGNAPNRTETVSKWVNTVDSIDEFTAITNSANSWAVGAELVILGWDPADTHTTNFWEELASVTTTSSQTTIDSGIFTAKKYLWIQFYYTDLGGLASNLQMFFNSDNASSNYAMRNSKDGAADVTTVSQNLAQIFPSDVNPFFANMFIINNSSNEKLCILHSSAVSASGAGTAPERNEEVIKWANTSEQITRIRLQTNLVQTFGGDSFLKVWGSD